MSFAKNIEKNYSLREKCPNSEFFLVLIFQHSDWIRRYYVFGHFSRINFVKLPLVANSEPQVILFFLEI